MIDQSGVHLHSHVIIYAALKGEFLSMTNPAVALYQIENLANKHKLAGNKIHSISQAI